MRLLHLHSEKKDKPSSILHFHVKVADWMWWSYSDNTVCSLVDEKWSLFRVYGEFNQLNFFTLGGFTIYPTVCINGSCVQRRVSSSARRCEPVFRHMQAPLSVALLFSDAVVKVWPASLRKVNHMFKSRIHMCECVCSAPDIICRLCFLRTQGTLNEAKRDFHAVAGFMRVTWAIFL